jgi:hypothetical protein
LLKGFPFSIVAMNRLHLFSGLKQKKALPFTSLKSIYAIDASSGSTE